MASTTPTPEPAPPAGLISTRRKRLQIGWLVANVAYAALRTAVAWATVSRYGVNIVGFAIVEVGAAIPYGWATAKLIGAMVDKDSKASLKYGLLSAALFPLPELYIGLTGDHMPVVVYVVLVVLVAVLGTSAIISVLRRVRNTDNATR